MITKLNLVRNIKQISKKQMNIVEKNTASTAGINASRDEGNTPDKESGEKPCVVEAGTKLVLDWVVITHNFEQSLEFGPRTR